MAVILPGCITRSVFLTPESCLPGYILLTAMACKKGVSDMGCKDTKLFKACVSDSTAVSQETPGSLFCQGLYPLF
jgi:hypothetical protein